VTDVVAAQRAAHLVELIALVKRSKSFTGDSRFSTIDGKRVLVQPS
jgi:hypothetical protein